MQRLRLGNYRELRREKEKAVEARRSIRQVAGSGTAPSDGPPELTPIRVSVPFPKNVLEPVR